MRNIQREPDADSPEKRQPSAIKLDNADARPGPSQDGKSPSPQPPKRWVPHRKAEIVAAISSGLLSLEEAQDRYALSIEEFLAWQHGITLFGLAGLRVYGFAAQTQQGEARRQDIGEPSQRPQSGFPVEKQMIVGTDG